MYVFDTTGNLEQFLASNQKAVLVDLINTKLSSLKINPKHLNNTIFYDTEEQCKTYHNGNWAKRLKEVG